MLAMTRRSRRVNRSQRGKITGCKSSHCRYASKVAWKPESWLWSWFSRVCPLPHIEDNPVFRSVLRILQNVRSVLRMLQGFEDTTERVIETRWYHELCPFSSLTGRGFYML